MNGTEHLTNPNPTTEEMYAPFRAWAADPDLVVLDTETTALWGEVIEAAVIDTNGNTLFNRRIRPQYPVQPSNQAIHGISDDDLKDCPPFEAVWDDLRQALTGKRVVIYNAAYDVTRLAYSLDVRLPGWRDTNTALLASPGWRLFETTLQPAGCAMSAYAVLAGRWNDHHDSYSFQKLTDACAAEIIPLPDAHSAAGDARATLALIKHLGRPDPTPKE